MSSSNKVLFSVVAILLLATAVPAQRPPRTSPMRPPVPVKHEEIAADFAKCGLGLTTLGPYITLLVEEVSTNDPEVYLSNIKQLYEKFRGVAANCGIALPKNLYIGNQARCKNDMKTLAFLFSELKNQMQKSADQQNLIALLTVYMSLAENLPKALEDCKITLN